MPEATVIQTLPYREAIDRIATTRTLVVRIALNAIRLSSAANDKTREELAATIANQTEKLSETVDVLKGDVAFPDLPNELSEWLSKLAMTQQKQVLVIGRMAEMTVALNNAAQSSAGVSDATLQSYIKMGEADFFEAVTSLVSHIWAHIENGRSHQLDVAMQSAKRLGDGLNRLERIGKYVRSMSINASVEASRAGEAGKGLAIIAQEFKTLAEEVQQLTHSARKDIESIEAAQGT
ncbi:methyl-accepting chemotaxis protein [Roseobacter sp.]|uniref:methyl-accepting chemotaxis protein n=1 Tax=Roseobacter sp. TaxID=1907202 RepID=UPI00385E184B